MAIMATIIGYDHWKAMVNEILDFFFCPMHGILRPQMWAYFSPFVAPMVTAIGTTASTIIEKCRTNKISEYLFCHRHGFFRHRD